MKYILCIVMMSNLIIGSISGEKLTVVTEERPPYNFTAEDGTITGIVTEVLIEVLKRAKIDAEIGIYPWKRAYKMALKQKNVLIYTIFRSQEREKLFKWVCPVLPAGKVYLYKLKKRNDIIVNSQEDAKKYMIGVMNGDWLKELLINLGFKEGINLEAIPQEDLNIKKLFAERIDLIPQSELTLAHQMKILGLPYHEVEKVLLLYKEKEGLSCMALSKKTSDQLVQRVRAALEQVNAEGMIKAITQKYKDKYQISNN